MKFRLATLEDADMLRSWRNDPETMKASFFSHAVSESEHLAWLKATLKDHGQSLYVAEHHGEPIGTLRRKGWQLAWTVAPKWRRRGLGTRMVASFVAGRVGPFLAEIKADNHASRKVAKSSGFALELTADGIEIWRKS